MARRKGNSSWSWFQPPQRGERVFLREGSGKKLGELLAAAGNESLGVQLARALGAPVPKRARRSSGEALRDLFFAASPSAGMIRGPRAAAVRAIMRDEIKARGPWLKVKIPQEDTFGARVRARAENIDTARKIYGIDNYAQAKFVTDNPWFSKILRGVWFHGRRTYPKLGETFAQARLRSGNFGEPIGLSVTKTPELFERHFAKTPEKAQEWMRRANTLLYPDPKRLTTNALRELNDRLYGLAVTGKSQPFPEAQALWNTYKDFLHLAKTPDEVAMMNSLAKGYTKFLATQKASAWPVARLGLRYGTAPEKVILPAWKGKGTEWAQEILRGAYEDALEGAVQRAHKMWPTERGKEVLVSAAGVGRRKLWDQIEKLRPPGGVTYQSFNEALTGNLRRRGFQGLLYHPKRFEEFELKLFDPERALLLDKRPFHRGVVSERLKPTWTLGYWPQKKAVSAWENAPEQGHSLRDIYKDIDLQEVVQQALGGFE